MITLSRRSTLAGLMATTGLPSALAKASALRTSTPAPTAGRALLDRLAWQLLALSPTTATGLGVDTGAHAALRSRLEDRSPAGLEAERGFLDQALTVLSSAPQDDPDPAVRISLTVAMSAFRTAREGLALPYGDATIGGWRNTPYTVIQNVGSWIDLPQLFDGDQPVANASDAQAYLARLADAPALLDGETLRIRLAREAGLVPPAFLLDKAITGLTTSLASAGQPDGPWIGPLLRKTQAIAGNWQTLATSIVTAGVIPALERQRSELQAQRAVATNDAGIGSRPHGAEFYAWALRASTTTARDPAELHAMGRARLVELQAHMDTILQSLGYSQGSVADRLIALQRLPAYAFPSTDAGRQQIVAYMQDRIAAIRTVLPQAFRRLGPGHLEIRRMPLAEEPGAPAAYGGPGSIDGSIPGKIWVNLGDPSIHNRVTIPDLVFHEGIPGHVWQGEYAQGLPLLRSILAFNAYSEGWALYAEQLADELGIYDHDPGGRLGLLMGLAWRAVRLVVDTGIHAMGWTRDRALDEFVAATGLPRANAVSEIDRYCAWPGQACGYTVGQTVILEQRTRARTALGARYDLRDFNQAVVDGGNVPMDVLTDIVSSYIASAKG